MNSDLSFFPDYIGSYFFSSCHSISNYLLNKYELIQSSDKEQFILHLSHIDEDLLYFYIKRIDKEEGWSTDLKIKLYDLHQKDYLILSLGNSSFAPGGRQHASASRRHKSDERFRLKMSKNPYFGSPFPYRHAE